MKETMNAKQLAEKIGNMDYRADEPSELWKIAKENNLLVIFGQSDDLIEFRGVMCDEADVYGCSSLGFITWEYNGLFCIDSNLPHAKFTVFEEGHDETGNGIVIKIGE